MNTINIQYLETLNNVNAQIASVLLSAEKENHYIDNINWPLEFSYCPDSKFIIARSEIALYIKFQIKETNIRSLYTNDQEAVWEDSCVEFFCKKQQSDTYMNFEFNCIGTCVATTRKGRNIDVIQAALGHSSPETTKAYLDSFDTETMEALTTNLL